MALAAGARLGPYEILSALGSGGMGEVYKATDTRLDRTVAIKILPPTLATDPQFRDRFDREARTISQLDHPHICALYDVGEQNSTAYLVMQYLEGETLADRLTKGALPLDQALQVAIQIADALATAHKAGIVHRAPCWMGRTCRCCRRRPRSRNKGRSSGRFSTWRLSNLKGTTPTRARTSSRLARWCTRCSRA